MYLVPFFDAAALSQAQRQLQKTIPAPPTQVPQITSKVCIRHQSHTTRSLFPSRHFSRFSLSLSLPFLSLIFFYLWKVNRVSLSNRLCRGSKSPSPCRVESSRTTPMRMRLRKKVIVNRGLWMKKGVTVASWQITHSFCFFFFFFFSPFFFLTPPPGGGAGSNLFFAPFSFQIRHRRRGADSNPFFPVRSACLSVEECELMSHGKDG